jgi:hypothetical protein
MRIITLALLLSCAAMVAQSPGFAWVKNLGGTLNDEGGPVKCGPDGNVYSTGSFANATLDLGGQIISNSAGTNSDSYLAKWNTDGNLIWVKQFGGPANQQIGTTGGMLTIDSAGNIYVAVPTTGSTFSVGGNNYTTNPGTSQSTDQAVIKYSADGSMQWIKFVSGSGSDGVTYMKTDQNGDLVMALFSNSSDLAVAGQVISGSPSKVLVKLSGANGNYLSEMSTSLFNMFIFDSEGNMYFTARFTQQITIGSTILTPNDVAPSIGAGDIVVYKMAADGTVAWVRQFGGNREDNPKTLTFDQEGNIVVAGEFQSQTLNFSGILLEKTNGVSDFLAKLDTDGNVIYAKHINTSTGGTLQISDLHVASDGNMYITGYNGGTMNLNGYVFTVVQNSPGHSFNQFVAKLNADGDGIWMKSVGGMSYGTRRSFAVDAANYIYLSGFFTAPTTTFDSILLTNPGTNTQNAYLAKLDPAMLSTPDNLAEKFLVYPSPAESTLYIRGVNSYDNLPFTIFDVTGRSVLSGIISSSAIDVAALRKGVYYLMLNRTSFAFIKN